MGTPARAIRIQPAFGDPDAVLALTRASGPYWPIARYAESEAERVASGSPTGGGATVPPWFRLDYAVEGQVLVPGAEVILDNPSFQTAAAEAFGFPEVVRPQTVYVNVMGPAAYPFFAHIDVPAFRGFTRSDHPVWLLHQMKVSGLFEDYRVRLATAVSWFYGGAGGAFHFWPEGPDGPALVQEPPFENVAVVADNEQTYHGVSSLGVADQTGPEALTVEGRLERRSTADGWNVVEGGRELESYDDAITRTTISWKAEVFTDEAERALVDDHLDDLSMEMVVDRFLADLERQGIDVPTPSDPHREDGWVRTLSTTYVEPAPRIV